MTDKKYTNEEIMEALANCAFSAHNPDACKECHYNNVGAPICIAYCTKDALELINRQESEQESEIERLKKEVSVVRDAYIAIQDRYEYTKTEAYKEFAERLENEINCRTTLSRQQDKNVIHIIHNLLKEMVGEE